MKEFPVGWRARQFLHSQTNQRRATSDSRSSDPACEGEALLFSARVELFSVKNLPRLVFTISGPIGLKGDS